jgi:hypothetical protein
MRKLLSTLTTVAALATVPLAAGCGADDLNPESVADAAQSTRDARTAKVGMSLSVSGFGVPVPLSVKGSGTSALDRAAMDVTFDLGPLLSLAGRPGNGKTRTVVLGKDVYVKPPAVQGFTLPSGADWVGLDVVKVVEAMGVDADGFGALVNADPGAQLEMVTKAKGIKEVGEETIDGAKTTHFRGNVSIKDMIATLPPAERKKAQESVDQLLKDAPGGDKPQPIDVWVDEDERVRRMRQQVRSPAQQGVPAGRADVTVDYSDFGAKLTARKPPAGDVYDATSAITRVLRQQAGVTTQ